MFTDDEIRRLKFKENVNKVLTLLFKYHKDEDYIRNNLPCIIIKLKEIFEKAKNTQEISMIFVYMFETFEIEIDEYRENINRIFKYFKNYRSSH